jgi:hypothetical protein
MRKYQEPLKQHKRRNVLQGVFFSESGKTAVGVSGNQFAAQKGSIGEGLQAVLVRASCRREDFVCGDRSLCGVCFVAGDGGVGFERAGSGSGAGGANSSNRTFGAGGNNASAGLDDRYCGHLAGDTDAA